MKTAVEFDHVDKFFRDVRALSNVDIAVHRGEVLGLLGANGAGKSTLLRIIQGVTQPTRGSVRLWGRSPADPLVRFQIGSTPQDDAIPLSLTTTEVIDYVGAHYPRSRPTREVIAEFGLHALARRRVSRLSGGQRRRVAVALACVGRPDLLLLDEPTTGLDVEARHEVLDLIKAQRAPDRTVIVTSHYLEDIEMLASRIVVLSNGRVRSAGPLSEFIGERAGARITLRSSERHRIAALPGADRVVEKGCLLEISTPTPDAFLEALYSSGISFAGLTVERGHLEDYMLEVIRADRGATRERPLR